MCSVALRDVLPGISAVLPIASGQTELETVVLDLGAVLDGLIADNYEILVVEFGRAGPTADLLVDMATRCPRLPLRVLPGAYADRDAALTAAFEASSYDLLFVTTADGQFDLYQLNQLLEAVERGADLAIGYRPSNADRRVKRFESWVRNVALSFRFGPIARDADCDFKLFRRVVWTRLRTRPSSHTLNAQMLLQARRLGFVIDEIPVHHHRPRYAERSRNDRQVMSAGSHAA